MTDAEKARKTTKWNRMSRRKAITRAHLKKGNYKIPTHVTGESKISATTKLEARSDETGYIDSCFPYHPYELCSESESQPVTATYQTWRSGSASTNIQNSHGRKLCESTEYTKLFLDAENDGSQIVLRNCGRLMSRRERRFLWASLELYRKRKRAREAREANLSSLSSIATDSENEMDIEPLQKRIKTSPFGRQDDWIPFESQDSDQGVDGRTRRARFAEEIQNMRASLSSSGISSDIATTSGLTLSGKRDDERTFCKERSRSPPMDRHGSESSTASRYHHDERHSIENIPVKLAGVELPTQESATEVDFRKRKDSGLHLDFSIPDGLEAYWKQHLDYTSRHTGLGATGTRLNRSIDSCLDNFSEGPIITEDHGHENTKADTMRERKHSISHIIITPPSPEADKTPLEVKVSQTPLTPLAAAIEMDTDMDKATSKTGINYVKEESIEGDLSDFYLPPPLLPIKASLFTERTREPKGSNG
ncbi:hypothetical protein IFR05_004637 [Cadophora sp. M221]|nr:hypothetical protein IFR05_004637 [Cadophora sp. M221]